VINRLIFRQCPWGGISKGANLTPQITQIFTKTFAFPVETNRAHICDITKEKDITNKIHYGRTKNSLRMQMQMQATLKRENTCLHIEILPVTSTSFVVFVLFVPFVTIAFLYLKD